MFALRFAVLSTLVMIGVANGQNEALTPLGSVLVWSLLVTGPTLYMLPTIEAALRRHPSLGSVAALNFFLGWTVVAWVWGLVWAFKRAEPVVVRNEVEIPKAGGDHTDGASQLSQLAVAAGLLREGMLTKEEFEAQKDSILRSKPSR